MCTTGIGDICLSSEEKIYYIERFNRGVIAFDHLEMAETIGEGIHKSHSDVVGL